MTVTYGMTGTTTDGGGAVNNGRRVLMAKTDSLSNVNNNNNSTSVNNNNGSASITGKASVLSVRRVLFGPPADPAETRAWLDRQLCAATAADSRSWNFDFVNERPLRDSPADRYAWERVCPPKRREEAAATDSTTTTTAQQQQQDCRRTAVKQQRQSKVTDFMSKTKKRPLSASGRTLRSNKVLDEPESANKRSRPSVATTTTMMAI
ncbi:PREDICTED: uncharacterized protein LOC107166459 [Diuraphis noxia]|uniref:uncharacterized protein LOC107166459 n=1 Tax=Diuraphis noxia TaxID=143948 RepID=UPI000763B7F9|nr:PREDICTED: uncharacterized protein LOC107166459 [Diuraphis noxia]